MFYLFNRMSNNAQKHLEPRYNEDSQTRFASLREILDYLVFIYVNPNTIRDTKHDYNSLTMK